MPPPANPGSRGGLITAVVIFAILFVTATIFAIYYGTQAAKTQRDLKETAATVNDIVLDTSRTSAELQPLIQARQSGNIPGVDSRTPLLEVAIAQRNHLARMIAGPQADAATVQTTVTSTLERVAQQTQV